MPAGGQDGAARVHAVLPGDTWSALALRYGLDVATLQTANPHPNRQRQPAIGSTVSIPSGAGEQAGRFMRSEAGGLLALAARHRLDPWRLAWQNGMASPSRPLLGRPLLLPGQEPPRELPPHLDNLVLSRIPALPGKALALRAGISPGQGGQLTGDRYLTQAISITLNAPGLDPVLFERFVNQDQLLALAATGAFFPAGDHELTYEAAGQALWSQPWRMVDDEWTYDQLTLTGEAAQIDAQSIAEERARLFKLWSKVSPAPQWQNRWRFPIDDYLAISSVYGARRSYNGGPYRTYHEGLDFSAYGGTPVYAPARGTVALAEELYVRGGAVIIDHGLGIYSGVYHMSAVHALPGQVVEPGDRLGEVGTSGLSTGNHLHWDLLVGGVWVDPAAWLESDMACWILEAWESECETP